MKRDWFQAERELIADGREDGAFHDPSIRSQLMDQYALRLVVGLK